MYDRIAIEVDSVDLEIEEEALLTAIEVVGVEVVEVSEPGPKGDKGDKGDAGIAGAAAYEELQIPSSIPTEYLLAHEPATDSLMLFVNGLRQHSSAFSLDVQTVALLADLQLMEGDLLAFSYAY